MSRDGGHEASTSSRDENDVEKGQRSAFTVIVRALDGKEWVIPVEQTTTVLEIKQEVKPHPVNRQRLIYLGARARKLLSPCTSGRV